MSHRENDHMDSFGDWGLGQRPSTCISDGSWGDSEASGWVPNLIQRNTCLLHPKHSNVADSNPPHRWNQITTIFGDGSEFSNLFNNVFEFNISLAPK